MESFAGTWRLQSFVYRYDDGEVVTPMGDHPVGVLMYDSLGNMSVHLSVREREPFANTALDTGTAEEESAAYRSYRAYFGTYTVDEAARTVTHHVIQSTIPHRAGTDLVRRFTFRDNFLQLETEIQQVGGRTRFGQLVWVRAEAG
jgi:hypothetical protein